MRICHSYASGPGGRLIDVQICHAGAPLMRQKRTSMASLRDLLRKRRRGASRRRRCANFVSDSASQTMFARTGSCREEKR